MSERRITQAVILCGGLGTRLRSVSQDIPKAMMPFDDRPFLEILVGFFRSQGVKRFVFCTGHLHEVIDEHFGNGGDFGVDIIYSREDRPLGTGGALKLAAPLLDDVFFFSFGDSLMPVELDKLEAGHFEKGGQGFVVVYDNSENIADKNIIIDENGQILLYSKMTSLPEMTGVEAGLSVFNKKILDLCDKSEFSLEVEIFPKLINRGLLYGLLTGQRFYDIGTPERLELARRELHDHSW